MGKIVLIGCILIGVLLASISVNAKTVFFDDFNRPHFEGIGNGWLEYPEGNSWEVNNNFLYFNSNFCSGSHNVVNGVNISRKDNEQINFTFQRRSGVTNTVFRFFCRDPECLFGYKSITLHQIGICYMGDKTDSKSIMSNTGCTAGPVEVKIETTHNSSGMLLNLYLDGVFIHSKQLPTLNYEDRGYFGFASFCDRTEIDNVQVDILDDPINETPCVPNWDCTLWSICSNNESTRLCQDINNCDDNTGKPSEERTCDATPISRDRIRGDDGNVFFLGRPIDYRSSRFSTSLRTSRDLLKGTIRYSLRNDLDCRLSRAKLDPSNILLASDFALAGTGELRCTIPVDFKIDKRGNDTQLRTFFQGTEFLKIQNITVS